jgi:hypothetical protein
MNPIKAKAHRAGALYVVFAIAGFIDLFAFNGFLDPKDAAATARNILANEQLFRLGILTDFATLVLFIFLVVSLYNLFESVDTWHARLMVLLVSIGVTVGIANLFNKFAPLILLSGAGYFSVFAKPQLDALVQGFLSLNSIGNTVDTAFWGLWLFPFGILVIKSGWFPKVLGVLLLVAGFGYVVTTITSIVLPAYEEVVTKAMMPLGFGEFPIILWLLIRGAKVPERVAIEESPVAVA